jgi:2'-5' RNA ligase
MSNLLVVNYPTISANDFAWIQDIRQQEDELNFSAIDPHFTLVFPIINIDQAMLVSHVNQSLEGIKSFEFTLRCAILCNDAFSKHTHVFLVPDEGYSNIVKLHDRLYTGIIASELRLDFPFIPHIGIANSLDPHHCKRLVDQLNGQHFETRGRIDQLDVISIRGNLVKTVESIDLA